MNMKKTIVTIILFIICMPMYVLVLCLYLYVIIVRSIGAILIDSIECLEVHDWFDRLDRYLRGLIDDL